MLKNDSLSEKLKEKLVDRSKTLLKVSPSMKENVDRDTKIISEGEGNFEDKINYYMHRWLANERERLSVGLMWKISGNKNNKEYKNDGKVSPPDWDSLAEQADEEFFKSCSNEFYMSDKMFKKKIKPIMETKKNSQANRTFDDSPEYDDLKLFLDVCNNQGIFQNGSQGREQNDDGVDLETFYFKRYAKILPFFGFLLIIALLIEPSLTNFYEATMEVTLLYGLLPNNTMNVLGVCWTLGVIFLFYLMFPAVTVLMKSRFLFLMIYCWLAPPIWTPSMYLSVMGIASLINKMDWEEVRPM